MSMNMAGDSNQAFTYRRALEALRNGVPSKDAVQILGCDQPQAETQFRDLLAKAADMDDPPLTGLGMLVSGEFGSGKSHLLEHLQHKALSQNFVCSRVTISKETPLYALDKVFRSAIDHGRLPDDRIGQMIEELGHGFKPNSEEYSRFFLWANREHNGLNRIFPATLIVHERANDFDLLNDIRWYWSGNSLKVARIKDGLRQVNQLQSYSFKAPKASELPPQRLRFVLELIKGAGYKGWVVMLDEIELVGSYSLLQRARSYGELARWMGRAPDEEYPGLVVVGTVAEDFEARILNEKGDRDYVEPRLRDRGDDAMAARAAAGMRILQHERIRLDEPTAEVVQTTVDKLRDIYSVAYNWDAPLIERRVSGAGYQRRMRFQVRASINEWDLMRLYPNARPDTEGTEFKISYEEDKASERESPEDSADALPEDSSQ